MSFVRASAPPAGAEAARSVLLHMCCGPCSLMPVQRLRQESFLVTGFFFNPNIHPLQEYLRRREAAVLAAQRLHLPVLAPDLDDPDAWNIITWLAAVNNPAQVADPSGPGRCAFCYRSRLTLTAQTAKLHGFSAFTTSLLYSRMQRHELIIDAGQQAAALTGIPFLYRDFRDDWQAGIDTSKDWDLYRQNYCGCIYSEAERFAAKLARLRRPGGGGEKDASGGQRG